MSLFVDTSALYALLDADDQFHVEAKEVWFDILDGREEIVTHNYILVETYALVQSRLGMEACRRLEMDLLAPVNIIWIDEELHGQGVQAHLSANERTISLVDRISFLVMRKRGFDTAFCFDADFRNHGFSVRPASS